MKRFHLALGVTDIPRSIEDYTRRFGCAPCVVVPGEYALWRTPSLNVSIRRTDGAPGALRHLGWEDPTATSFTSDTDTNGVVWEHFSAEDQNREILDTWPHAEFEFEDRATIPCSEPAPSTSISDFEPDTQPWIPPFDAETRPSQK